MKNIKNIRVLNHFIIIIFGSFYLVDVLLNFKISYDFSLIPSKTLAFNEIWRILSYPLTFFTIESAILFLFTVLLIFPFFEVKFRKPIIFVLFFSFVLLQGLLFSILFQNNELVLKGTDGISFFIITFFLLNNFNLKQIRFNEKLFHINGFIVLIAISWIVTVYFHSNFVGFDIITPSVYSFLFGITFGFITNLIIKIHNIFSELKNIVKPKITAPTEDDLMPAEISKPERKFHKGKAEKSYYTEFDNDYFSEDKLNQILDKINNEGENSLTDEELNYLKEYSRRL